jgi:hypothetical protein
LENHPAHRWHRAAFGVGDAMIRLSVVEQEFSEERSVLILDSSGEIRDAREPLANPGLPDGFVFILGRRFNLQHSYDYFYRVSKPFVVQRTKLLSHASGFGRIELAERFLIFWQQVEEGPAVEILTRQITKQELLAQKHAPHWITKRILVRRTDLTITTSSLPQFLPRHRS